MLEEDIKNLFEKVRNERESNQYRCCGVSKATTSSLKEYMKLVDNLLELIITYLRLDNIKDNSFKKYIAENLDKESDKIYKIYEIYEVMQNRDDSYIERWIVSYVYYQFLFMKNIYMNDNLIKSQLERDISELVIKIRISKGKPIAIYIKCWETLISEMGHYLRLKEKNEEFHITIISEIISEINGIQKMALCYIDKDFYCDLLRLHCVATRLFWGEEILYEEGIW